jgi:hypothetical protein
MEWYVTYEICINSSVFHPEVKEEFIMSDEREGIGKKIIKIFPRRRE